MIVAVIGKGGVGKTTISSLLLGRLLDAGETPLLAIDADPSNCLGPALGLDVTRTLAEFRDDMREGGDRPPSMSQGEWLALRAEDAMVESRGFDLLTMGHPEGKGCYCYVNNLIRDHLDRLARSYRHVLLDCEAGLEHLSRRTTGRPDVLVCVTSRARMAAETIHRSLALFADLHGALPPRIDLVLNGYEPDEPLAGEALTIASSGGAHAFARVIAVPHDPAVCAAEAAGRSLLTIPTTTPAVAALHDWTIDA